MSMRSLRVLSLSSLTLWALPNLTEAQATPAPAAAPQAAPEPGSQLVKKDDQPIEAFDLDRALVSDGPGLTSAQVAKLAVEHSAQITSAEAQAESARWDAKAAWVNFLPSLQVFGQYKRISKVDNNLSFGPTQEQIAMLDPQFQNLVSQLFGGGGGASFTQPLNNWSTGATLRVPASDIFLRIWPAYEASSNIAEARAIQTETTRTQVAAQAREAFYGYARALAFRAVQDQSFKQQDVQARQVKLFVDAGTAAPVELMLATARLEQARGQLARADGLVAITRTILATVTGLKKEEIAAIAEPVTDLPSPPSQTEEQLVARAFEQRAELRALRKVADASGLFEKAEKHAAWPQLVLEGNTLYANPNPRYIPPETEFHNTWDVSATLVWTPNQAISAHAKGKGAEANLAKARADLLALQDAVRIEVVQAYEDYKAADAAARSAEAARTAAEEAYRVRMEMYRVGAGIVSDLVDADLQVTQARLAHINAVLDARTALVRLDRAAALDQN